MDWYTAILIAVICIIKNTYAEDTSCKPRPVVKTLTPLGTISDPRTKIVEECSGFDEIKDEIRTHDRCVPVETDTVEIEVIMDTGETKIVKLKHHKKCAMRFVCEVDHQGPSKILHTDVPCPEGLKWQTSTCKCVPDKAILCPSTQGPLGGGFSIQILISALVAQLLLILAVLFIGYHCRHYRKHHQQHTRDTREELGAQTPLNQSEKTIVVLHDGKETHSIVPNNHCLRNSQHDDTPTGLDRSRDV